MKVKDLIDELSRLPENATIGTLNYDGGTMSDDVPIMYKKEKLTHLGDTCKEISNVSFNRKHNECDYYIVS
jgi:hypothetical protein